MRFREVTSARARASTGFRTCVTRGLVMASRRTYDPDRDAGAREGPGAGGGLGVREVGGGGALVGAVRDGDTWRRVGRRSGSVMRTSCPQR